MSEEARNFLNSYGDFVTKVTSEPSMNQSSLDERMKEIDSTSPIESARLLTAALGLGSETGEFVEIVKKMFLQLLVTVAVFVGDGTTCCLFLCLVTLS